MTTEQEEEEEEPRPYQSTEAAQRIGPDARQLFRHIRYIWMKWTAKEMEDLWICMCGITYAGPAESNQIIIIIIKSVQVNCLKVWHLTVQPVPVRWFQFETESRQRHDAQTRLRLSVSQLNSSVWYNQFFKLIIICLYLYLSTHWRCDEKPVEYQLQTTSGINISTETVQRELHGSVSMAEQLLQVTKCFNILQL